MISLKYRNAFRQVLEILKYIPEDEFNKIPKDKIEYFENNQNKDYDFKFDIYTPLEKQNISKETNSIILNLFNDYFINDEKKTKLKEILEINENKIKKYDLNDVFHEKHDNADVMEIKNLPIKSNNNIFKRLINYIKRIFKINL